MIHIDHYSTDAEIQKLAGILRDKGPDALRDALWDLEAATSASAAASAIPSPWPVPGRGTRGASSAS